MPITFDAIKLGEEVRQLPDSSWMAHPNNLPGNSAVALISSGGGNNNSFEGAKAETPHLDSCPYIRQVMASFNVLVSRSRLMKLEPGAKVNWHVDFNYHWYDRIRLHVPVITNEEVIFHCGPESVHMKAGDCWIFDHWRRHSVDNNSTEARVHLVIDTCGSSEFWRWVSAVENLSESEISEKSEAIEYCPGKPVDLKLERYSGLPVMAPGELSALIEDLITDFSAYPENDPKLILRYQTLMRGFAADWRMLWLQYQHETAGLIHYQTLIQQTRDSLEPNMRALVTNSNQIGVNAVFAQRVLNAALTQFDTD